MPTQSWSYQGRLFNPETDQSINILESHAAGASIERLEEHRIRIYSVARDANSKGHIFSFETDLRDPFKISGTTLIASPQVGSYDQNGIAAPDFVKGKNGEGYIYYVGLNKAEDGSDLRQIYLLKRERGSTTFERFSSEPVMGRNQDNPFGAAGSHIMEKDDQYEMWYTGFMQPKGDQHFRIKYARSEDGVRFDTNCRPDILLAPQEDQSGIAHPFAYDGTVNGRTGTHLWYGLKKKYDTHPEDTYNIGYTYSKDGKSFERLDNEINVPLVDTALERNMNHYPSIMSYGDKLIMITSGAGFGRGGLHLYFLQK